MLGRANGHFFALVPVKGGEYQMPVAEYSEEHFFGNMFRQGETRLMRHGGLELIH